VDLPIGIEVAASAERTQTKDGLGSGKCPASAAALHAVFDEVAARSFDDPCRNGESPRESFRVAHVRRVFPNVLGGPDDGRPYTFVQRLTSDRPPQVGRNSLRWLATQKL
jgi:hypothetical protein